MEGEKEAADATLSKLLPHEVVLQVLAAVIDTNKYLSLRSRLLPPRISTASANVCCSDQTGSISQLLSVLLTCRSFYYAGVEVFYGSNTFVFDHPGHLRKFAKDTRYLVKRHIRSIQMTIQWDYRRREHTQLTPLYEVEHYEQVFDVVSQFTQLKILSFVHKAAAGISDEEFAMVDDSSFESALLSGKNPPYMVDFITHSYLQ